MELSLSGISDDVVKDTKPTTPKTPNKVISGRVTKQRSTPRKVQNKDYKKMIDPLMEMDAQDENGENVFGNHEKSEDEESDPTDAEYGAKRMVKTEEGEEAI